jgi:putative hemolysin
MLNLPEFQRLYALAWHAPGATFSARALHALDLSIDLDRRGERAVPAAGPLIVVANHPRGMADGLALISLVERSRQDVRVLTNELLASIPELADMCLFVNAFERRAAERSRAGLRAAVRWLRQGHALIVFPAGAVAHGQWQFSVTPSDGPWRDTVARLAMTTGATVVPAYIAGRNRHSFYLAGEVHPMLRTLLLGRELLAQRGGRIVVRLGRPLTLATHHQSTRSGAATGILRAEVERLGDGMPPGSGDGRDPAPVSGADLAREIARLDVSQRLIRSGRFDVYCATADELPNVLNEIGRLREATFRSVGEGTGQAIDIDRFDAHYEHLFVWDREMQLIAGAYRIGPVDCILASHGIDGLYTSTLYRYDHRLIDRLGPALELGRSFVRAEYQRGSNALLLLWKGIARFVLRSGKYRVLFGPVSISARYSDTSRQLLQAFLLQNARHRELTALVTPITPPDAMPDQAGTPADIHALDRLIAGLEPDGKGVPVLLRQYLRLDAKLLAFNIDPAFGDALDALMMVDLARVDRAILTRYFGSDGAEQLAPTRARQAAA